MDFTLAADEHGMMTDAYCFAGRLDFALAANLNLWASYIWAHRLERAGTYFGQYQSSGSLAAGSIRNLRDFYARAGRSFGTGADYVSNGFIGWEMNYGVDWKLLENLAFRVRYSYWQPGDWFKEAYHAVVVTAGGNTFRAGVLHSRDPVHAVRTCLSIEF
jgi:opacity protein-like surface antigen